MCQSRVPIIQDELEAQVIVPSTTCLYVMVSYLLLGTVMFAEWESWGYLDSVYFCVTSLLKIGFGDFVPGTHAALEGSDNSPETQVVFLLIRFSSQEQKVFCG